MREARRLDVPPPRWEDELTVVYGLLALRRAGRLHAIWIEDGIIRVREEPFGPRRRLSWAKAAAMAAALLPRKPAARAAVLRNKANSRRRA